MTRHLASWLRWWVLLTAVWLLLILKTSVPDLTAAALAGAAAATLASGVLNGARVRFDPPRGWLRQFATVPKQVLSDSGTVLGAILRRLARGERFEGEFRRVPFHPGGPDPADAARRALVVGGMSIAPNTYVVAVDHEAGELVVHQLVHSPQPPGQGDPEWPL